MLPGKSPHSWCPRKLLTSNEMPSQNRQKQYWVNFLPCLFPGQKNLLCQSTEVSSDACRTGSRANASFSDPAQRPGTRKPRGFEWAHYQGSASLSPPTTTCCYQALDKKTEAEEAGDLLKDTWLADDLSNSTSVFLLHH